MNKSEIFKNLTRNIKFFFHYLLFDNLTELLDNFFTVFSYKNYYKLLLFFRFNFTNTMLFCFTKLSLNMLGCTLKSKFKSKRNLRESIRFNIISNQYCYNKFSFTVIS